MVKVGKWLVALVWCLAAPVFAQASATTDAYDRFMATATGAAQTTVTYGKDGTPVATPSSMTLTPDGGAGVKTTQSGSVRNPAGNAGTITATGRMPNSAIVGALGRFFGKVIPVTGWAIAVKELVDEMGFIATDGANGVIWESRNSEYCAANCQMVRYIYGVSGPFRYSALNACTELVNAHNAAPGTTTLASPRIEVQPNGSPYCKFNVFNRSTGAAQGGGQSAPTYTAAPPNLAPNDPSSMQAFLDAVAARSGWPSTSSVAKAAAAAAAASDTLIVPETVTVTGPAQTQGSKSTTTSTNPDGSTRTETVDCKWNHTYSGPTIVSSEVCTTTTTNDGAAGQTTTKTKTSEGEVPQKTEPAPELACGIAGKPACNVKVDESGTPAPETLDGQQTAEDKLQQLKEFAQDPKAKLPQMPTLNWSFELPTGCVAIAVPAFDPWLQSIDVCQFMPMFHDIMTMIWVIGGLFGAISMFWRSTFSAN